MPISDFTWTALCFSFPESNALTIQNGLLANTTATICYIVSRCLLTVYVGNHKSKKRGKMVLFRGEDLKLADM